MTSAMRLEAAMPGSSGLALGDVRAARQLKEGLERVHIPAWMIDERGVFKWVNDAFVELFGDQVRVHYSTLVAPEHRQLVDLQFARKLNGTNVTDYEIEAFAENGERVVLDVSTVRLDPSNFCGAVFGMGIPVQVALPRDEGVSLTPRQQEILRWLAAGASTTQIADELTISRETVRNHIRDVLSALDAHSRLEAVVKARRLGLVRD